MTSFTCILEVWHEDKIAYINAEFAGGSLSLPSQTDMSDREDILEKAKEAYSQFEILDFIGVMQEGEVIWVD